MAVPLWEQALPSLLFPLAYKLPLDWMLIAQCKEQNREVIKPRMACWCLWQPGHGLSLGVLPNLQRRSLESETKPSSETLLLLITWWTQKAWCRWQNTKLGVTADAVKDSWPYFVLLSIVLWDDLLTQRVQVIILQQLCSYALHSVLCLDNNKQPVFRKQVASAEHQREKRHALKHSFTGLLSQRTKYMNVGEKHGRSPLILQVI